MFVFLKKEEMFAFNTGYVIATYLLSLIWGILHIIYDWLLAENHILYYYLGYLGGRLVYFT